MEIKLQDIFYEIARVIKATHDGDVKVYQERIADLKTPSYSIELISFSTPIHSQNIINKRVDLDIIYFSNSDTVAEALRELEILKLCFSLNLPVYARDDNGELLLINKRPQLKRSLHVLQPPTYRLVEQDLHFQVTYEFADEFKPIYVSYDDDNPIVSTYNTHHQTLENKEVTFKDDVNREKKKEYTKDEYKYMEDLTATMNAVIEL